VVIFRSHYEDVLAVRVHELVPHSVWSKRFGLINDFEKILTLNGTTILKFSSTSAPKSSYRASSSGSTIRRGNGRSVKATTPNASYGRSTWTLTRTPSH
jgi:Polyphosphate kinase 2 (PPK2)